MFFILSKLLALITSPFNLIFFLLLYGLYKYKTSKSTKLIKVSLLLLYFITNGFISNQAIKLLEYAPIPISKTQHHQYGVVLSGITQHNSELTDRVSYSQGVNRLYHAFNLFKANKIDTIIVTGGNGKILSDQIGEADKLAITLKEWGVPNDKIIIENKAQNTHQNAVNSIKLIPASSSAIIITSAFHMYRSEGCFKKAGANFTTFPTDYYSTKTIYTPQQLFLPNSTAINRWDIIFHELVGILTYKIMGYI